MNMRHEMLRRLRDPRVGRPDAGWAGRSLDGSIQRVILIAIATFQGLMALAAIWSLGLAPAGLAVAACHLVGIGAALAVLRYGRGQLPLILGSWALFVVAWAVSPTPESTLLFTACWMCNLTSATPAVRLRGKASWWAPLAATVTIPVLMVLARPEWAALPLVHSVPVTLVAITLATRIGLSYVIDYTAGVDAEARALQDRTAALTTRKAATHQAAEDARVLHDTAINTLGAIASGGAAIDDIDAVRQRCLADVATIDALRSAAGDRPTARTGLRDDIRAVGIRVCHTGLPEAEIARIEALLPPSVIQAFSRATAEAVQNAAKHSGAPEVVVCITRTSDGVRVTVSDQGVGIRDGLRRDGGVERSILARARQAGIRAAIDSAPGRGTTVTLGYALGDAADAAPGNVPNDGAEPPRADEPVGPGAETVEDLVRQLRWRAVYALSAGLVGVGVVLSAVNHPGAVTPDWLMVAVVALACGLAWRERERARLSMATVAALLAAGPVAFVLSAWSVGFGRVDPTLWQAIAPTGPLLVLTIVSLPRPVTILGFAAYLLAVVLTAVGVAPASREAAAVILVAGLVGVGLIVGVLSFVRSLAAVAARAHAEQQQAFRLGLEMAAVEAATETRRRWREAGLEQSVRLLRAIGDGRAEPHDPAIRQRCAEEEAFLRQLSLLNPELIQMGTWFARALNTSRLRGVGLTVRAGAVDATADHARDLGGTLLAVVESVAPGTRLTTALFATVRGLTMTLVAPTPHLASALSGDGRHAGQFRLQTLGNQDLVELVVTGGIT